MMDEKGWNKELATAYIMQKRPELGRVPGWMWSQILLKKKETKNEALSKLF